MRTPASSAKNRKARGLGNRRARQPVKYGNRPATEVGCLRGRQGLVFVACVAVFASQKEPFRQDAEEVEAGFNTATDEPAIGSKGRGSNFVVQPLLARTEVADLNVHMPELSRLVFTRQDAATSTANPKKRRRNAVEATRDIARSAHRRPGRSVFHRYSVPCNGCSDCAVSLTRCECHSQ